VSDPIRVPFPWHKTLAWSHGGLDWYRWKPGIRWEDGYEDREAVADGMGAMLLVEIGRYTPPGYRERVFYTRQFVLPDGTPVGTPKLRVIAAAGFTRLCKGYRYPVELVDTLANVTMEPEHADIEDLADAASY
jgi:hypothetical protein